MLIEKYLSGGFVFYGGLYGALLGAFIYLKAVRRNVWDALRVLLPLVPLVHGFGRVGCFLTGCCYGVPSRFGIAFVCSPIAPNGVRLLPVQLIEAAGEGALFFALTRPGAQRRGGQWMLGVYLASYGVLRFLSGIFPRRRLPRLSRRAVPLAGHFHRNAGVCSSVVDYINTKSQQKASQSFRRGRRKIIWIIFAGGMYVGKNTSRPASVEFLRLRKNYARGRV